MLSLLERKKQVLESRLATKIKQWEAENRQFDNTLDASQKIIMQDKIDALWTEIEQLEEQLSELELKQEQDDDSDVSSSTSGQVNGQEQHSSYRGRNLDFDRKFPKIDFQEPASILREVLEGFDWKGGDALFLLQNSRTRGGKWCLARIREILKDDADEIENVFLHHPVDFSACQSRLDEVGVLEELGKRFGVEQVEEDDLEIYTQKVVRTICGSIGGGITVYVELKGWDRLKPPERILRWFLENFWALLMQSELSAVREKHKNVKFIVLMVADDEILSRLPDQFIPSLYSGSESDKYYKEKLLELKLRRHWTEDEIVKWLGRYQKYLSPPQVQQIARDVYQYSNGGDPRTVYFELMDRLQ